MHLHVLYPAGEGYVSTGFIRGAITASSTSPCSISTHAAWAPGRSVG